MTLQAVVAGYQDHMFDLECLAVNIGFWCAYYTNAKRAKPINTVLTKMQHMHDKYKQNVDGTSIVKPKPDVDVEAFLEQERAFKERSEQLGY